MKLQLVSVRDNAVEAFMQPTFVNHVGAAIREFNNCVNDPQHEFSKHPADYDLYHLGDFDSSDGSFIPPSGGVSRLVRAQDVKVSS